MGIPSFFEDNAYRVLRLSAGATISEAHEAASRMKRLAALDLLKDATDEKDRPELGRISRAEINISNAISRIQQPKSRLLDRLFWFHFPAERIDEEKLSLLRGRFGDDPEALAAILHDRALQLLVPAAQREVDGVSAKLWATTLTTWHDVVSDEAYWALTSAIEERGQFEPVAFPSEIAEVGERAQKSILRELVNAAHRALNDRNVDGVSAVLAELAKLEKLSPHIRDAMDEIVSPLQSEITKGSELIAEARRSIRRVDGEASANLVICNSNVELYRRTIEPALTSLARLLPEGDAIVDHASRDAAKCLQRISIDLTWAEDFTRSETLHEEALKLAGNAPIASEIEEGLKEVRKIAKRQKLFADMRPIESAPSLYSLNGVGFTVYGNSDYDDETRSSVVVYYFIVLFFPVFPIARYRVIREGNKYRFIGKLPLRKVDRWHLGLALIAIFGVAVWASTDTASTSTTRSVTYTSRPTIAAPVPNRLAQLKNKIEAGRAQHAAIDARIKPALDQLSAYQSRIEEIKKEIQAMDAQQALGRSPNETYYNARVREHNELLAKYRALYAEKRVEINQLIELEDSDKTMVAEYNSLLRH